MTDVESVLRAIRGDIFSEQKRNYWENQKYQNTVWRSNLELRVQERKSGRRRPINISSQYWAHGVPWVRSCVSNASRKNTEGKQEIEPRFV